MGAGRACWGRVRAGIAAPSTLSSAVSVSRAAEQAPEGPVLPTLWVPYSGCSHPSPLPYLTKAPWRCWERVPGLQNWTRRPWDEEGRVVLSPSPFCRSLEAVTTLSWLHSSLGFLVTLWASPSHLHPEPLRPLGTTLHPHTLRPWAAGTISKSSLLVSQAGNIYPKPERLGNDCEGGSPCLTKHPFSCLASAR